MNNEKIYEILVLRNHFVEEKIKYKRISFFSFPQLEYTPYKPPAPKTGNSPYILKSQKIPENTLYINYPKVFLCSDNYLLLENSKKIYLVDFKTKKFTMLYNKEASNIPFSILYTYDENISKNGIRSTRTYVFGITTDDILYYFIIENNYMKSTETELIMFRMYAFSKYVRDIKIQKFINEKEDAWYYFIACLTETDLHIIVTDWNNLALKNIIFKINVVDNVSTNNNLNTNKNNDKTLEANVEIETKIIPLEIKKFAIKRLFLTYKVDNKSCLLVANGESVIALDFNPHFSPAELKKKFRFDSQFKQNNVKGKAIPKPIIFDEEIVIADLKLQDVDYWNYELSYVKDKIIIITRENIYLKELNNGKIIYKYVNINLNRIYKMIILLDLLFILIIQEHL